MKYALFSFHIAIGLRTWFVPWFVFGKWKLGVQQPLWWILYVSRSSIRKKHKHTLFCLLFRRLHT